jgi:hypothetical protein
MKKSDSSGITFHGSLNERLVQSSRVHLNVGQDVIVVTEDRLRLCLRDHLDALATRRTWLTPLSLVITIGVVLVSSSFKDFLFSASTWEAVFIIGLAVCGLWLIVSCIKALRTRVNLDLTVRRIKESPRPGPPG